MSIVAQDRSLTLTQSPGTNRPCPPTPGEGGSGIRFVLRLLDRYGPAAAVHYVAYRALSRLLHYRAFVGVVTTMDAMRLDSDIPLPEGYRSGFVTVNELGQYVDDPGNDLSPGFLEEFRQRGCCCYGIFHGERLVSYSFYAHKPVSIDAELMMHFDPRFTYVYKSFTLREHRGLQLHSIGMSRVLHDLRTRDESEGLIAYVESTNYGSLRSGARMGHREFGVIRYVRLFGRGRLWRSPGCAAFGFQITLRELEVGQTDGVPT
jgi:hypothetical protein